LHTHLFCVAAALLLAGSTAFAQGYPAKPVRVIVPHPTGGGPVDGPARGLAEHMSRSLGQTLVVENRDGGDGIIGTVAVVKSAPDGYTLLFTSASVITLNALVRAEVPYDSARDLTPVAYVGAINSLVLVHPSVPAGSLADLIALAKAKPDTITWGTLGTTSIGPLLISLFKKEFGASFYMIPYKSTVQALLGTVAGEINVTAYAVGEGTRLTKAGKLRALAVTGAKRPPELPDVPTLEEAGVNLRFRNWVGLFAPAGTPVEVVRRLNAAAAKALADPQYTGKFLDRLGIGTDEVTGTSAEQFAAFIKTDRVAYENIVKIAGIQKR
jgi:tripartite-type tricarboxylate transporter receptor subunit TctC